MKVYGQCKSCGKEVGISVPSSDRVAVVKKRAEEFTIECQHCASEQQFHIDELNAKRSLIVLFAAFMVAFGGCIFLWNLGNFTTEVGSYFTIGFIYAIPFVVAGMLIKGDQSRVRRFNYNRYRR